MKYIAIILTFFIINSSFGQTVPRTPGTTTVTDGKLITVQSFAIPKTTLGGNLNGGIADSLGYIVLSKGDSSVYVYYAANKWRKVGNDSAYVKARFDTSARTLTLYRINKDSTVLLIPAGSGSGSGATDYSWSVVGNTVSQLWNNGANHSFDKSDSRITTQMVTNISTIPNGGETLQSVTNRDSGTTHLITAAPAITNLQVPNYGQVIKNQNIAIQDPANFWIRGNANLGQNSNVSMIDTLNKIQINAGNDYLRIGTSGLSVDQIEGVFSLGDNGYPYRSNGQRFRFNYNADNSGIPKDVMIIDYDTTNLNGDLVVSGKVSGQPATNPQEFVTLSQLSNSVISIAATSPILTSASTGAITLSHATSGVTAGSNFTKFNVNSTGHITSAGQLASSDVTTALGFTPLNPTAYPVNLGGETLASILARGNQANNSIALGDVANTSGYNYSIARNFLGYQYSATMAITGNDVNNGGLNLIATGQGTSTKTQYLILSPGLNAPVYSPDNQTTKYTMLHTGNITLQNATSNVGANTTNNAIQVTGGLNLAGLTGVGAEMEVNGGIAQFFGYDRTGGKFITTQFRGGTTSTANTLQIASDLTYNSNQVWYSGGVNSTSSIAQFTGGANVPVSGAGVEVSFQSGIGGIAAFNRSTSVNTPLQLSGGNNTSTQNKLLIQSTLTYNGNEVFNTGNIVRGTGIGGTALTITNTGVTSYNGSTGAITQPTLASALYTPTVTYSGSGTVTGISVLQSSYTRVGNIVHVAMEIGFNASVIGLGAFTISLPFNSTTTTQTNAGSGAGTGSSGVSALPTIFVLPSSSNATCNFGIGTTGSNLGVFIQFDYTAQ